MSEFEPRNPDPLISETQNPGTQIARPRDAASALELLRAWREGDEQEQRETWEFLRQALDEDRLSHRKLFP